MLIINRFGSIPGHGAYGEIPLDDTVIKTVECHWENNAKFVSCIPCGTYELVPFVSNIFTNSEGRTLKTFAFRSEKYGVYPTEREMRQHDGTRYGCIIHGANLPSQLKGCLSVGESHKAFGFGGHKTQLGVTNSKETVDVLLDYIRSNGITHVKIQHEDICK